MTIATYAIEYARPPKQQKFVSRCLNLEVSAGRLTCYSTAMQISKKNNCNDISTEKYV